MPKSPDPLAGLSPFIKQIVSLVGRRADDAEVVALVTKTLGQKVPTSTTDAAGTKNVVAKKHGVELAFSHDVKHEQYPLVPKSKSGYIPYLSLVWLKPNFKEPLPFGIAFGMSTDDVTKQLGVAPVQRPFGLSWKRVLEAERGIVFRFDGRECTIGIDEARELSARCGVPPKPVVGLFVAWAAQRSLLAADRAGPHTELLEGVRTGKRKGSELVDAAWPRGLWDVHLVDKPGLRDFAFGWFHNIGGAFINRDLIAVFGERQDEHGHPAPALDDDDAAAVKKATRNLDAVFAKWV